MRIALIAAGAGGMYCGSCLRDDTLARALRQAGHDVLLIPAYTPLTVEREDTSLPRVFLGGVNVYLQQHAALFRHTPGWIDRLLDAPSLLRRATRRAGDADPAGLAELTLSILAGERGRQRKEVRRLVSFLRAQARPDLVNLPNALFLGLAEPIRRDVGVPVVCELTGCDAFVDRMRPEDRQRVRAAVRERAAHADAFIATSAFYADYIADYYGLPRERIAVVPTGIDLDGFDATPPVRRPGGPLAIGYLARVCREKGLHLLADAYARLRALPGAPACRLLAAGYLSGRDAAYLEQVRDLLRRRGVEAEFDYVGAPDRAGKLAFLRRLDVFSVPATFLEPKGIYVLEALAAGVPVVQPAHGSFPELIAATGGGRLFAPDDADALARTLLDLLTDEAGRAQLGQRGAAAVRRDFSAARMAQAALDCYRQALDRT